MSHDRYAALANPQELAATRRLVGWLCMTWAMFIVYGSLVPFHFGTMSWGDAIAKFSALPLAGEGAQSAVDRAVNVLLPLPLAFLMRLRGKLESDHGAGLVHGAVVWLCCAALAVLVEFAQVFMLDRTASLADVSAQWVGAMAGLLLHARWGAQARDWTLAFWNYQHGRPLAVWALQAYLAGLLAFAMMPLDLTLSPVEVYRKFSAGRVFLVPFSDLRSNWTDLIYETTTDVLIWLPVGYLWRASGTRTAWVLGRVLLASTAIECLQLFVFSRVTSSSDIVTAVLGGLIGAVAAQRWKPRPGTEPADMRSGGGSLAWWPMLAFGAWLVLCIVVFWYPFDFQSDRGWLRSRLQAVQWLPFEAAYQSGEFHALNAMLRKLLVFLAGGLLWALPARAWIRDRAAANGDHSSVVWVAGMILLTGLAALVECGQLLLPSKFADVTDFAIQASGGCMGIWLGRRLSGLVRPRVGDVPAIRDGKPTTWGSAGYLMAASLGLLWCAAAASQADSALPVGQKLAWVAAWLLGGGLGVLLALRWPGAAVVAVLGCQAITPRYGPPMDLLLALQFVPLLGLFMAWSQWLDKRRQQRRVWIALIPDGCFALFFIWVLILAVQDWSTGRLAAVHPLYHPVNYLGCALLYAVARNDTSTPDQHRLLAKLLVACIAMGAGIHLWLGQFLLNGHVALLMALALPCILEIARTAGSAQGRWSWWGLGAMVATLIVMNQNRSAFLAATLALWLAAVLALRTWKALLASVIAMAVLLSLLGASGMLDRFLSVLDPGLAAARDDQAIATVQSRFVLWAAAWDLIQAHPWAGVGPGQFEQAFKQMQPGASRVPAHNTWLTVWTETGTVGLVLASLAFGFAWLLAMLHRTPDSLTAGGGPFSMLRVARTGLVVCAVYGLFNSRADFPWAYFLAGFAVPALGRRSGPGRPDRPATAPLAEMPRRS